MVGLVPKWVKLDPKLDKSGTFLDQISVHLALWAKCTEIWSEKVPDLSNLGSNLTHFKTKPTIPAAIPDYKQRLSAGQISSLASPDKLDVSSPAITAANSSILSPLYDSMAYLPFGRWTINVERTCQIDLQVGRKIPSGAPHLFQYCPLTKKSEYSGSKCRPLHHRTFIIEQRS